VGWKAGVDKTHIQVLDADGNDLGVRNLSAIPVAGDKPWITSYDFIAIAPGVWVQASLLELQFCSSTNVANAGPDMGHGTNRHHTRPTGAYGSGNGC
jgi:hypothetical protein